ncbi:M20/M25/M40 family metallo-hydrolase [Brevibacterium sp. 50QC2O2]|uniref:M20/M25/M40 family metallo-hydrolase n=1 Tax=Brevibacterium TaxID=1696 RepID=UPI00211D0FF8|nr:MULTISPECIES: M20/M25/M40 family metallo-hydrolase [unclassified Brevibacterium]MCQ9386124.1 M20/M25/M40 family metallo-hydrolase [Brevibacterium sp. 68QC2CO]MCQ9387184.1 M20/M25/M40 family metallo-hydrolase [Brevibacterium sp. 50QC2O2]
MTTATSPAAEQLHSETLELLQALIRNACANDLTPDSGQEVRSAETLEEFFAGVDNVTIQKVEPRPGRTTIIVTLPGTDPAAEPLTLLGHTDVVPVDADKWTKDPFGAVVEDGAIWGRGAVDMLCLTASMAVVTRQIARAAQADPAAGPAGTLTFVGVADEEARGGLGAKWLSEEYPELFSWKNCLSETGGSHLPVADGSDAVILGVGEKGAAQRRLHVTGDAGHGSLPYGRDFAVAKIGRVAEAIGRFAPAVAQDSIWEGYVKAFRFDEDTELALLEGTDQAAYEAFGELAPYAHAVSHLTVSPTVLRAGEAINVFPSAAYLELDIRTLPGQTDDEVDAVLRGALGELADEVRIERLISEPASASPTDSELFKTMEQVVAEHFPDAAIVPTIASGGSDLRFARKLGGVGYGFGLHRRSTTQAFINAQLHQHDEHLPVEDLYLTVDALDQVVRRFTKTA